jgi:hypothetical protein
MNGHAAGCLHWAQLDESTILGTRNSYEASLVGYESYDWL